MSGMARGKVATNWCGSDRGSRVEWDVGRRKQVIRGWKDEKKRFRDEETVWVKRSRPLLDGGEGKPG